MREIGVAVLTTALLLSPALAHAAAAQILFALNRVEIQRGEAILPALRGAAVEVGDTLHTGPNGYAQLRFKDGALMSLRPGASLKIEDYALPAAAPAAAAPVSTAAPVTTSATPAGLAGAASGGRSVLRLLRGAFRTITGAIGKNTNDIYRVVTPTATIGIRGTDYSAAYCESNCGTSADGLYVGVSSGEIFISNDAGELVLYDNQYSYIKDSATAPEQTLTPPDPLETPIEGDDGDESTDEQADAAAGTDAGATEDSGPPAEDTAPDKSYASSDSEIEQAEPEGTYELQPNASAVFAFTTGPFQTSKGFAGAGSSGAIINAAGELTGMRAADTQQITSYSIGNSQNTNQGFDPGTGLRWGRWSGGVATVGGQPLDLSNKSLHWIYAATASTPVLPVTGTLNYTLVGNTNPTDNLGNVGFLGTASFSACFSCANSQSGLGTVASTLDIGINNQVWSASGGGDIISGTPLFAGNYSSVSVDDTLGQNTGVFAGFFTNNAAAAGLSYSLSSGTTTVSGAAAFGDPTASQALIATDGPP